MALLFMDGFDHYGTVAARLLDGVYSSYEGVTLTAAAARTGPRGAQIATAYNDSGLRWRTPTEVDVVGYGFSLGMNVLPHNANSAGISQIITSNGAALATLILSPTGAVQVLRGGRTGTLVGISAPEAMLPGSNQHVEVEWNKGAVEVRIDGTTVVNVPDVGYDGMIGQIYFGGCYGYPKSGAIGMTYRLDDLFVRDDQGDKVNTWVGDRNVYLSLMNSDGTISGWVASDGLNLYDMIDNIPPEDASKYIYATAADDKASFGFSAFPSNLISITAVQLSTRAWKTDSGDARLSIGMSSGSSEQMNDPHDISAGPRWFRDVYEVNPATGLPWLVSDLNSASAVIERTE